MLHLKILKALDALVFPPKSMSAIAPRGPPKPPLIITQQLLAGAPFELWGTFTREHSTEAKSIATPRGNMKAARSVNHRGLPGGSGLGVCMRRPQQLYGPGGIVQG
jgi:hypothetical protein